MSGSMQDSNLRPERGRHGAEGDRRYYECLSESCHGRVDGDGSAVAFDSDPANGTGLAVERGQHRSSRGAGRVEPIDLNQLVAEIDSFDCRSSILRRNSSDKMFVADAKPDLISRFPKTRPRPLSR